MMRVIILLALLLVPTSLRAQAIDSLAIPKTDSISETMGRPVVAAFVLPDLSGSTAVDSVRVQVKIVGGSWTDYYVDGELVKIHELETWVLRGFAFDSLRFVADSAQADTMQIHFILR